MTERFTAQVERICIRLARANGGGFMEYWTLPLVDLADIVAYTIEIQKEEDRAHRRALAKAKKKK